MLLAHDTRRCLDAKRSAALGFVKALHIVDGSLQCLALRVAQAVLCGSDFRRGYGQGLERGTVEAVRQRQQRWLTAGARFGNDGACLLENERRVVLRRTPQGCVTLSL